MVGHRVSQAELYDDRDVIIQILKLKDTVNDYAGGIIDSIDVVGDDLVIDWADGTSISLPLPSPTGISSVAGAVSGGNLTITFYMTDGSSHAFTTPLSGMASEAYVDAKDAQNVKLTGAQSVAGVKTFTDSPIVPTTPVGPTSAVNDVYVNDATPGTNNILHKTGNESKTGTLTMDGNITMNSGGIIMANNPTSKIFVDANCDISNPPGSTVYRELMNIRDMNGSALALLYMTYTPAGRGQLYIRLKNANGTDKNILLAEGDP